MQTEDLEYLALRFFYGFFPVLFHQTTKSLNIEYSLFSDIYIYIKEAHNDEIHAW